MSSKILPASRRARAVHPEARAEEIRAASAKRLESATDRGWQDPNGWTVKMVRVDGTFTFLAANTYAEACAVRTKAFGELGNTYLFGWVRESAWRSRPKPKKERAAFLGDGG